MSENGGFGFRKIGKGSVARNNWDDGLPEDQSTDADAFDSGDRLPFGEDDRLPWLESPDDVEFDYDQADRGRVIGFLLIGLLVMAVIGGAIWWFAHNTQSVGDADGSLIEASKQPYKVRPQDAGGKVFDGTGDTSYLVSEGIRPQGSVAASEDAGQAAPAAPVAPAASGSATPAANPASAKDAALAPMAAAPAPGTGVQIGAFSTRAAAEAAWTKFQSQHEPLQGRSHRVLEGRADIGTVYRLQAVAADAASARSLCSALQAGGLKCQVK